MAAKPRWPAWISTKSCTAMGLDMPHLVWKFYEKNCFSFLDMVQKRKKWTKNNNNNNKKELDENQESSPLLRWSLITGLKNTITITISPSIWKFTTLHSTIEFPLGHPLQHLVSQISPGHHNTWNISCFTNTCFQHSSKLQHYIDQSMSSFFLHYI